MVGCYNLVLYILGFSRQFFLIYEDVFCIVEMVMPQQLFHSLVIISCLFIVSYVLIFGLHW